MCIPEQKAFTAVHDSREARVQQKLPSGLSPTQWLLKGTGEKERGISLGLLFVLHAYNVILMCMHFWSHTLCTLPWQESEHSKA